MIILVVFSVLHVFFFLFLAIAWYRIPVFGRSSNANHLTATVIVPVRNEVDNIATLLEGLSKQTVPKGRFEVIFVDDHSTDGTYEELASMASGAKSNMRVFRLSEGAKGKKAAATLAVQHATHDLIVCTDGDCRLQDTWLEQILACFDENGSVMISAPVRMYGEGFFTSVQALEFGGLIGYGGITLSNGIPGMCNGANMAYRKEAFMAVDGYSGNRQIPSGDDEFLLQKVSRKFPGKVMFLKSRKAIVQTEAKSTLLMLLQQRIRWTSKWKFHKSLFIRTSAILVFADFATGILLWPAAFLLDHRLAGLLLLRWAAEWAYLGATSSFLMLRSGWASYLAVSIFYPFYAVFLGLASIFGRYSWKGRTYG